MYGEVCYSDILEAGTGSTACREQWLMDPNVAAMAAKSLNWLSHVYY